MNAVEIARENMERTAALRTAAIGTMGYRAARIAADKAKAEFIAVYDASKAEQPFRAIRVANLHERIRKETAQRAELVKWIAQIDANVAAAEQELAELS